MTRKKFTSEFKAKVTIEAFKGHKTITELSSEFGAHPTQIYSWKKQLIDSSKTAFNGKHEKTQRNLEEERDRLYAQIGKQKVELDWLKKRQDISIKCL